MYAIDVSLYRIGVNIILGRSTICIIAGILPILDSILWPSFRLCMLTGFISLLEIVTAIEDTQHRIFARAVIHVLGPLLDNITLLLALTIALHFSIPSCIRYINFEVTDCEMIGLFLMGAIPMGAYISTVLFLGHAGAIWSFTWRITAFGLPSFVILHQIWSSFVSQQRREALGDNLLKSLKYLLTTALYQLQERLEFFYTLFTAVITLLNHCEALVINLRQKSGEDPYQYQELNIARGGTQLQKGTQKIRLLKLRRRKIFTRMECELLIVNINDAPPYEAISYTWGKEEPSIKIIIDNATLKVTPAVSEILGRRHSFLGAKLFWIDSICINQKDDEEKSQQVTIMKEIYSRASRVVVWLGPLEEAKDAYIAEELLMSIVGRNGLYSTSLDDIYRDAFIEGERYPNWDPVVKLFQHPWFSRVWIVQEVAVGTTVHVMYGKTCVEWEYLAAGIGLWADPRFCGLASLNFEEKTDNFPNALVLALLRRVMQSNQPISLSTALCLCYGLQASDLHDKVYAMLGIVGDRLPDCMTPNYSKPVSKVYEDTMHYLLSRPSTADLPHMLQFAGTGWPRSSEIDASNIPSWVADWSSPRSNPWLGVQSESWIRQNELAMQNLLVVQVVDGLSILKVEAVKVDKIGSLGTKRWDFTTVSENYASWFQEAKSMAQLNCDAPGAHEEFPYASFWRTLTGGAEIQIPPADALSCIEVFWDLCLQYKGLSSISKAKWSIILKKILEMNSTVAPLADRVSTHSRGKVFCITGEGHLAMVPPHTKTGDSICFLKGIQSPFILREKGNLGENSVVHYELVGSCYVDGIMDANREGLLWERFILE